MISSQTVRESSPGAQTVLASLQTVWESPAGAPPIKETVLHRRSLSGSLLQVFRRSWHLRKMYENLMYLPAGLGDCLASSQTVWESPAFVKAVFAPSQTVWKSPAGTLNATSCQSSAFLFMSRIV
ncbi:hypothetical protein DPMN_109161 [Dreissena polymorpha]|uniref:Uncharacterized protein n=1 Tax=Dreissena polymorpha TaxID=45954 RepID=A0A9D4KAI0_DREPO|nr:hypothetical protein DPMN_109161 [Dreissena polymorpha]